MNIWKHTNSVHHRNTMSGHSWVEEVPTSKLYHSKAVSTLFGSVEKVREDIDLVISMGKLIKGIES